LLRLAPIAEQKGFLYCFPDGTIDKDGNRFWNATDACCDFYGQNPDDSGYLRGLIEEIGARYALDRKRVFLIGHSNGGVMSYRMACDHADLIAAIISLSGETFLHPDRCTPSQPVNVLEIHATADTTAPYIGDFNSFPSGE